MRSNVLFRFVAKILDMRCLFILWCFCGAVGMSAQPLGTLRGILTNASTTRPIDSVAVALWHNADLKAQGISDINGRFVLENVAAGSYILRILDDSYGIYEEDVVVVSGQETQRDLKLEQLFLSVETVEVTARRMPARANIVTVTYDDVMRMPAAYDDPARLLQGATGITSNFDGANGLVVRGLAPVYTAWTIEGMEVVNPNHLSNAGTFSDLGAQSSGGASAISAQIIDRATLYKGPAPIEVSNGSSFAVFDVGLRKGNMTEFAGTAQLGLVGTEVALEGPIKKGVSSFLANYRYSTVGILSKLGVTFGGEAIAFQDAALHFNYEGRKNHSVSVFGIWGSSSNDYTAQSEDNWEIDKHSQNINYGEQMLILGASDKWRIGNKSLIHLKLSMSEKVIRRDVVDLSNDDNTNFHFNGSKRLSFRASYQVQILKTVRMRLESGISRQLDGQKSWPTKLPAEQVYPSTYYYVPMGLLEFEVNPSPKFLLKLNVGVIKLPTSQVEAQYELNKAHHFYGTAGLRNIINRSGFPRYTSVRFYEVGWQWAMPKVQVQTAAFRRNFEGVPSSGGIGRYIITVADGLEIAQIALSDYAKVRNYGIESGAVWRPNSSFRIECGGTWYRTIQVSTVARATPFSPSRLDGKWASNLSVSKEWTRTKSDKKTRTWGFSAQAMANGGMLHKPINESASAISGTTVFEVSEWLPSKKQYFRTDARVYYRRFHRGYTSTLALDIQNVTNAQNIAWEYYDNRSQAVLTTYQLGTIPTLSYRVAF